MAAPTLPVLSGPHFAHVFAHTMKQLLGYPADLTECAWSDEHCDCRELATVHHLESEQEFCLRHFQAVRRG